MSSHLVPHCQGWSAVDGEQLHQANTLPIRQSINIFNKAYSCAPDATIWLQTNCY